MLRLKNLQDRVEGAANAANKIVRFLEKGRTNVVNGGKK